VRALPARTAAGLALLLAVVGLVAPWTGHVDDTDAQLYQVVARHMVEDGRWLDLRYLPGVHPQFREHLPFGLWPFAAAIRLAGEGALAPLAACFSLGTLLLTLWVGRRLGGWGMAALAVLVLGTTESFILYAGRPRLDPLLLLLVTASVAPLLAWPPAPGRWLLGAGFAAGATLVKGPFGLLPYFAAGLAVAWEVRSPRLLLRTVCFSLLAAVPVAAFLLADRTWGAGTWWRGYLGNQLLASATGTREDGLQAPWFPLATVAGRFWPGLPLLGLGVARAAGWPKGLDGQQPPTPQVARLLLLCVLLLLGGLALPLRKVWHHALVAYPLLALLGAAGAAPWVRRGLSSARRQRAAVAALAVLVSLALGLLVAGGGARVWKPCVGADEFAVALDHLSPGDAVLVVSNPPHWRMVASLAAERRLEPWLETALGDGVPHGARLALVQQPLLPQGALPPPWQKAGEARGWVLLRRE